MPRLSQDKVNILVVEDNDIDVMGIERAFGRAMPQNRLVVASDGREALDKLRDNKSIAKPYLVLLDLNMPRMNGIEFLDEIRRDPTHKSAIVFIFTTSEAPEDKKKSYERNIAGYLVKEGTQGLARASTLISQYIQTVEFPTS